MNNKINNIIFDWAGVISDSTYNVYSVAMKIFDKYQVSRITLEQFRDAWIQPYMDFYQKYIPNIDLEEEQIIFAKEIQKCPPTKAYPGIIKVIHQLKNSGKYLTVLSSDLKETLLPEMKRFELDKVFDDIELNVHDKQQRIEKVIKQNKMDINETCIVGDTAHEIAVGKSVGIKTVAVTWGYVTENKLREKNPDYIFNKPEDLLKII